MRTVVLWKVIAVVGTALLLGVFLIGPFLFNLTKKYSVEAHIHHVVKEDERKVTFYGFFPDDHIEMTRIAMRTIGEYPSDSLTEMRSKFSIEVFEHQQLNAENISALQRNLLNSPPYYTSVEAFSETLVMLLFTQARDVLLISSLLLVAIVLVVRRQQRAL